MVRKYCHNDPTLLFSIGKARIWGGSKDSMLDRSDWALVITAAQIRFDCPVAVNEGAAELIPLVLSMADWKEPPIIRIDWPDYGVPALPKEWWKLLVETLKGVEGDVAVCCQGGHGRTGTALAILATLSGRVPKKADPVLWLRQKYCKEAVESASQLMYFTHVTGKKTSAEEPKKWYGQGSSYTPPASHTSSFGKGGTPATATGQSAAGGGTSSRIGEEKETPFGKEVILYEQNDELGRYYLNAAGDLIAVEYDEDSTVEAIEDEEVTDEDDDFAEAVDRMIARGRLE